MKNQKNEDKIIVKELMEDVNLLMFNCKLFSFDDMKKINETIENIKNITLN